MSNHAMNFFTVSWTFTKSSFEDFVENCRVRSQGDMAEMVRLLLSFDGNVVVESATNKQTPAKNPPQDLSVPSAVGIPLLDCDVEVESDPNKQTPAKNQSAVGISAVKKPDIPKETEPKAVKSPKTEEIFLDTKYTRKFGADATAALKRGDNVPETIVANGTKWDLFPLHDKNFWAVKLKRGSNDFWAVLAKITKDGETLYHYIGQLVDKNIITNPKPAVLAFLRAKPYFITTEWYHDTGVRAKSWDSSKKMAGLPVRYLDDQSNEAVYMPAGDAFHVKRAYGKKRTTAETDDEEDLETRQKRFKSTKVSSEESSEDEQPKATATKASSSKASSSKASSSKAQHVSDSSDSEMEYRSS